MLFHSIDWTFFCLTNLFHDFRQFSGDLDNQLFDGFFQLHQLFQKKSKNMLAKWPSIIDILSIRFLHLWIQFITQSQDLIYFKRESKKHSAEKNTFPNIQHSSVVLSVQKHIKVAQRMSRNLIKKNWLSRKNVYFSFFSFIEKRIGFICFTS